MPTDWSWVTELLFAWMCEDTILHSHLTETKQTLQLVTSYVRTALIGFKPNRDSMQKWKTRGLLVIYWHRSFRFSISDCRVQFGVDSGLVHFFFHGDGGCVSRRQPTARENHPHSSASDRLSHPTRTEWMWWLRGSPSLAATRSGVTCWLPLTTACR